LLLLLILYIHYNYYFIILILYGLLIYINLYTILNRLGFSEGQAFEEGIKLDAEVYNIIIYYLY
jgi:hypothetical protein